MQGETGADRVLEVLAGSVMSAVNVAEVLAKLVDKGMPGPVAVEAFDALNIEVAPFGLSEAVSSLNFVHPKLSLGDRASLATAAVKGGAAVTADTIWKDAATNCQCGLCALTFWTPYVITPQMRQNRRRIRRHLIQRNCLPHAHSQHPYR
jgi:PIN domain nuclease of toxin-antitoxin system